MGELSEPYLHKLHDELLLCIIQNVSMKNIRHGIIVVLRDVSSSIVILFNIRNNHKIEYGDKPLTSEFLSKLHLNMANRDVQSIGQKEGRIRRQFQYSIPLFG